METGGKDCEVGDGAEHTTLAGYDDVPLSGNSSYLG